MRNGFSEYPFALSILLVLFSPQLSFEPLRHLVFESRCAVSLHGYFELTIREHSFSLSPLPSLLLPLLSSLSPSGMMPDFRASLCVSQSVSIAFSISYPRRLWSPSNSSNFPYIILFGLSALLLLPHQTEFISKRRADVIYNNVSAFKIYNSGHISRTRNEDLYCGCNSRRPLFEYFSTAIRRLKHGLTSSKGNHNIITSWRIRPRNMHIPAYLTFFEEYLLLPLSVFLSFSIFLSVLFPL